MSEDDAGPRTLEPTGVPGGRAGRGVARAFWSRAAPAFAVAALVLCVIPLDGAGDAPPIRVLLLAGLGVAVVMTGAVWLAIRFDLGLGVQVAAYAAAFNVLVIVTKLVLGPYALYEVNQTVTMSDMLPLSDPFGPAPQHWCSRSTPWCCGCSSLSRGGG